MKWLKKILDQLNEEVLMDEFNTEQNLKRLANLHRKNKRIDKVSKNEKLN